MYVLNQGCPTFLPKNTPIFLNSTNLCLILAQIVCHYTRRIILLENSDMSEARVPQIGHPCIKR